MTRFSEIAHDIESQYDPNFDLDMSKTAPPVSYIEYRLLELCETLNERLTALEAKTQTEEPAVDWRAKYNNLNEMHGVLRREFDEGVLKHLNEVRSLATERNALAAEVDDLRNVNAGLREDNAKMAAYTDALKKDNERMTFDLDQERQHAENRNKRVAVLIYENGNLKEENRHLRKIANQEAK